MSASKNLDHKLLDELKSAIDADKMYWVRNDAKIRAVQSSKTYDEFRDIVAAAHLSPLSRKEIMQNKKRIIRDVEIEKD